MNIFTKKSNVIKTICVAGVLIASPAAFAGTTDSNTQTPGTTGTQQTDTTTNRNTGINTPGNTDATTNRNTGVNTPGNTDRTTDRNTGINTPGQADTNTTTTGTIDTSTDDRSDSDFSTADSNMDDRLDRSEVDSINREALGDAGWDQEESFDQYDEDGNNYLDQEEYENYTADLESDQENRAASVDDE